MRSRHRLALNAAGLALGVPLALLYPSLAASKWAPTLHFLSLGALARSLPLPDALLHIGLVAVLYTAASFRDALLSLPEEKGKAAASLNPASPASFSLMLLPLVGVLAGPVLNLLLCPHTPPGEGKGTELAAAGPAYKGKLSGKTPARIPSETEEPSVVKLEGLDPADLDAATRRMIVEALKGQLEAQGFPHALVDLTVARGCCMLVSSLIANADAALDPDSLQLDLTPEAILDNLSPELRARVTHIEVGSPNTAAELEAQGVPSLRVGLAEPSTRVLVPPSLTALPKDGRVSFSFVVDARISGGKGGGEAPDLARLLSSRLELSLYSAVLQKELDLRPSPWAPVPGSPFLFEASVSVPFEDLRAPDCLRLGLKRPEFAPSSSSAPALHVPLYSHLGAWLVAPSPAVAHDLTHLGESGAAITDDLCHAIAALASPAGYRPSACPIDLTECLDAIAAFASAAAPHTLSGSALALLIGRALLPIAEREGDPAHARAALLALQGSLRAPLTPAGALRDPALEDAFRKATAAQRLPLHLGATLAVLALQANLFLQRWRAGEAVPLQALLTLPYLAALIALPLLAPCHAVGSAATAIFAVSQQVFRVLLHDAAIVGQLAPKPPLQALLCLVAGRALSCAVDLWLVRVSPFAPLLAAAFLASQFKMDQMIESTRQSGANLPWVHPLVGLLLNAAFVALFFYSERARRLEFFAQKRAQVLRDLPVPASTSRSPSFSKKTE